MSEALQTTIDHSEAIRLETSNDIAGEKYILFEVAGCECGVPADSVLEVVHSLPVSAIPNSPQWLLGLSIFRGEPVAMIRPGAILPFPVPDEMTRNCKTIVFRTRDDQTRFALPVDRISEIVVIPGNDAGRPLEGPVRNGTPVRFIDPYSLFSDIERENSKDAH